MTPDESKRLIATVSRRLDRLGWIANACGAVVVFFTVGFGVMLFFDQQLSNDTGRANLPFVVIVVTLLGVAMTRFIHRERRAALAWLAEGREPSADEHRRTLRLPAFGATVVLTGWILGALVSGVYNLHFGFGTAAIVVASVWLGGETTSALNYLLSERTLRPITALALTARPPERAAALGVRSRLLFAWSLGTGVPILGVLVIGIVGLTKSGVDPTTLGAAAVFLGAVAVCTGLSITLISARAIADPLDSVRTALDAVAGGDLAASVAIDDASEIGQLQAGFNRMAEGLREREHIRDLFGRQVGRDVAHAALGSGVRLGGEERQVGALFVDLVGSTSMALAMPPSEVVRLLNKFFRVVVDVVDQAGGIVNKFEGDAALCVFGAPVAGEDPAGDALRAARELAARLERDVPEVGFGIGVSAGAAVAGNVGSEERFEYTVIGDPVNEAARLCDLAKERQQIVLASGSAVDRGSAQEAEHWSLTESTILRGRLEATRVAVPADRATVETPSGA